MRLKATHLGRVARKELGKMRVERDVVLEHQVRERAVVARLGDMPPRTGVRQRQPLLAVRLGRVDAVIGVQPLRVHAVVGAVADIRELQQTGVSQVQAQGKISNVR